MGLIGFFHGFVSNLITAGIKLVPLGQSDGQRTLRDLEFSVYQTAEIVLDLTLDDLGSAALMVDWTSFSHEHQYTRLFRS
jgi:urease accessory protein